MKKFILLTIIIIVSAIMGGATLFFYEHKSIILGLTYDEKIIPFLVSKEKSHAYKTQAIEDLEHLIARNEWIITTLYGVTGNNYLTANGVKKDIDKGLSYLNIAADKGYRAAQMQLIFIKTFGSYADNKFPFDCDDAQQYNEKSKAWLDDKRYKVIKCFIEQKCLNPNLDKNKTLEQCRAVLNDPR